MVVAQHMTTAANSSAYYLILTLHSERFPATVPTAEYRLT
jgi:hypothetical protein